MGNENTERGHRPVLPEGKLSYYIRIAFETPELSPEAGRHMLARLARRLFGSQRQRWIDNVKGSKV